MTLEREYIKKVMLIIKETEEKANEVFARSSLEKPIQQDIILSIRNSAYHDIRAAMKGYKKERRELRDE